MRTKGFLAALGAATLLFILTACQPDEDMTKGKQNQPDAAFYRPPDQCSPSVFIPLVDGAGNTEGGDAVNAGFGPYGSIELADYTYGDNGLTINMGFYWLLEEVAMFAGDCASAPHYPDGTANVSAFPYQSGVIPARQFYTLLVPRTSFPAPNADGCWCVSVYVLGAQADFFGNVFNATPLWAQGPVAVGTNGHGFNYCTVSCPTLSHGDCYDVDPAGGRLCTDITATISTVSEPGAAPFTFTWSTGFTETNSTGSSTISVCPTSLTMYTVTAYDSRSLYTDLDTIWVNPSPTCVVPPPPYDPPGHSGEHGNGNPGGLGHDNGGGNDGGNGGRGRGH